MSEKDRYLTKLIEHINKALKRKKTIVHEDKLKLWHDIDITLKEDHEFDNYNSSFCKQLFDNMFICSYKYESDNKLDVDIFIEDQQVLKPTFKVPDEYKSKLEIFNKLKLVPQPEQKSPEWFKQREGMITASMIATVTGDDPYSNISNALEEKVRGAVFKDNINTYHGKKYEPIAQKFYSLINNVEISEFGIIRSEKYDFLGASPDGICTCYTLNKDFSPLLGRMLEIKCPAQRDIKTSGNLLKKDKQDGIVPYYYWCQTQLQMEVCNLDECDFFQCSLSEYNNREEYLRDTSIGNEYYREQGEKINVKDNIKKGAIIELMPKKCINLPHIFMAKYIYPETIDMNTQQYDDWAMNIIYDFNDTNELSKEYYFSRVIYWKMNKSHIQLIKRDKKWFEDKLPLMDKFWKDVVYYKQHTNELDKYLEELRKKEKKIGGSDYFKNKIPEIYKKLSRSMDLTTNPYTEDKTDTVTSSIVSPAPKRTSKGSVFMKPKETQKKFYNDYDFDFLSDT